jgi:hypothetical protein
MTKLIAGALVTLILFIIGWLNARKANEEAKVIDLIAKIGANKDKLADAQKDADAKVAEYQKSLKELDPDFYNDDGDGKPAS